MAQPPSFWLRLHSVCVTLGLSHMIPQWSKSWYISICLMEFIMCKEWEIRGNPVMAVDSCENLVASGNLLHSHGIDGHSK